MHNIIELPRSVDPLHIYSDEINEITKSEFHNTDTDKSINEQFRKEFFWAMSSVDFAILSTKDNITNKEIFNIFNNRQDFLN
jgi:hypothetical protein